MGTGDGRVVGVTKILDNGPDNRRFNIVVLAEGYQVGEQARFANDAADFVRTLATTPPFHLALNAINVHRVDVESTDSGADDPTTCGGAGTTAATYFDATFCSDGTLQRLVGVDWSLATSVATTQVPQQHVVLVIVNTTMRGGQGNGGVATYTRAAGAVDIALHELGHSAFGLADEYEYWRGCASGETDRNAHPTLEPREPNVTTRAGSAGVLKWSRYVVGGVAVPTTTNANPTVCDPQASPVAPGRVGAFEGAHYYHSRAWRPEFDCRMRNEGTDFCHVCSDVILRKLATWNPVGLRVVWKGADADQRLWVGRGLDGDQQQVRWDGGTATSSVAPSLTGTSTGPFLAWKGQGGDQRVYHSRLSHIDNTTWERPRNVPGAGTSTGPTVASYRGAVHMVWKGISGDRSIYTTSFGTGIPATPRPVSGTGTSTRPALAVYRDRLFMAWRGIDNDQSIWFTSFDGNGWAPQRPVPGVGTSASPALAVLGDRLYMVWKGIDAHQDVWFSRYDGTSWAAQLP